MCTRRIERAAEPCGRKPDGSTCQQRRAYGFLASVALVIPLLGTTFASPPAQARSVTYDLDIPAQSLNDALQALALASQHKLLYSSELVDGKTSPNVKGKLTTEQAVRALLSETDLSYEITSDGFVLIRAAKIPVTSNNDLAKSLRIARLEPEPAATTQVSGDVAAEVDTSSAFMQEVVVTSRKTEESLQEVPLSVAAVSGDEIEKRSIESLEDLGQSTPNFSFSQPGNAGRMAGVAFIRGVGQRDPISAYDPAVGIYLDGVYMGRMYANNLDMLEIERVEVLRGPQGTLFGKNTSGGAISIVTKQPNLSDWSGSLQLGTGSRDRLDVIGSVNIPLVAQRLALRLAGARNSQDGYGRRLDGQEMADTDRSAMRAQLLFEPAERISALLRADWMNFDEKNASFKLIDTNPNIPPLVALNSLTSQRYDDRWVSPSDYFSNATGPNSGRGTARGTSLTLTYDADWAKLVSISAYRDMDVQNDLDPDGSPVVIVSKFEHLNQDQMSQELQASGSAFDDRLTWLVGAYYFRENIDNAERYDLLTALFGASRSFNRIGVIENESVAGFAQGTYKFTDKLRFTLGLRYTEDDKTIQATQSAISGAIQFRTPEGKHQSNVWSPRVGLDYRWTPEVMTYVSVAQGAKNGGFNGRVGRLSDFIEFDDEVVWTYELGLRSDLFDRRARFNVTAFYSNYSDLQLTTAGTTVLNGAPSPFSIISNIPKAETWGGELELLVAPTTGLTLFGGLGLTYGKYVELPTDARFIASRVINKDSKFSHMPEASFTAGTEYSMPMTDAVSVTGRVDYAHKSKIYYLAENTANSLQPAYGLLNARLTFGHDRSGVSVSLFGTNLTDEAYAVGAFDDATTPNPGLGFAFVNLGPPREWGVSVLKRF